MAATEIAMKNRVPFDYAVVDEAQDLTVAQLERGIGNRVHFYDLPAPRCIEARCLAKFRRDGETELVAVAQKPKK